MSTAEVWEIADDEGFTTHAYPKRAASKEDAVIEIEDNGPGMTELVSRRVFEPFFTTREVGSGTGLGMSVSYSIITVNHGGQIDVWSEPGKGARFTISLPLEMGPK